jgi:transcriptional regulator with XRE-family HTH domain
MATFSKRLNAARRMRGLSQSDLASKTGLKQVAISLFETGRRAPSFGNLKRLADALEVTSDYLMGRSEFAEVPVEIVAKSFRDERKLSSKDVKFLQRIVENLIRAKNGQQQLRDGLKGGGAVVTLGSLFS